MYRQFEIFLNLNAEFVTKLSY